MLKFNKINKLFYTSDWYSFEQLYHDARKKDKTVVFTVCLVDNDGVHYSYNFRTRSTMINFVLNKCVPSLFTDVTCELACILIRGSRTPTVSFAPDNSQDNLLDPTING